MVDVEAVAIHEAGHVVIARALGCVVHAVALAPRARPGHLGQIDVSFRKNKISASSQRAMVCLGGDIAQHLAFPRSERGDDVDLRLAHDAAAYVASDPRRYLEMMRARTRNLVMRHWRAVELVAAALLERSELTGREIDALICEGIVHRARAAIARPSGKGAIERGRRPRLSMASNPSAALAVK